MSHISVLLLALFVSLGFSSFIIPKVLLISFKKNLFDELNERKVHTGVIPRLGGVSFAPAIIFTLSMMIGLSQFFGAELFPSIINSSDVPMLSFGLSAMFLLYLTGVADDLIEVRYLQKFVVQIVCAVLIVMSGLWFNSLYGIFGIYEWSPWIGKPFTVFVIVFLTNAINLIDGIDGLASGLSSIALIFFVFLFAYQHDWIYAALSIVTLGAIIPFFYFNVFGSSKKSSKIFMGDTGALTIGLVLSILAIRFSMYDDITIMYQVPNAIIIAFSLLLTPVFDVVRVVLHRLRFKQKLFAPDKNHIHHKFLALGFSHRAAMITILSISVGFAVLNMLLLSHLNINVLLFIDVLIWTVMHIYMTRTILQREKQQIVN